MMDLQIGELFPIQSGRIFLDNASSTRKPTCVLDALREYDAFCFANVGRGSYRSARNAQTAVEDCRDRIKSFLGAGNEDLVVFTHGATDGLNLLARGFLHNLQPASNVVTTIAEHHSNLLPWMRACNATGAQLRIAKPLVETDAAGNRMVSFPPQQILDLMDAQTAVVVLTAASNVTGTCLPIEEIANAAHKIGIPVIVDGAQLAAHREVRFDALGCDAICLSSHKLYGPTGLGIICAKKTFLESLMPDDLGGGAVERIDLDLGQFWLKEVPDRLEAGTLPIAQILGFGASIACLQKIGMDPIHAYEDRLRQHLLSRLSEIQGIRWIHGGTDATAVISLVSDAVSSLDLASFLDARGIEVRAGKHCAYPFLDFLGEPSTLRVSPCFYNTMEEIDSLADVLQALQRRFCR